MTNDDIWRWANEQDSRTEKARKIAAKVIGRRNDALRKLDDGGNTMDKLDQIFEMQAQLDNRIIRERNIEKSLDEWVIGLTVAMESEIDELRREVNWRWWKNPRELDIQAIKEEVIDLWHFLVSLSQKVGLTADDVYRVYCEKNAENHARQDGKSDKEGYAVKEKRQLDELLSKITPENWHEETDVANISLPTTIIVASCITQEIEFARKIFTDIKKAEDWCRDNFPYYEHVFYRYYDLQDGVFEPREEWYEQEIGSNRFVVKRD